MIKKAERVESDLNTLTQIAVNAGNIMETKGDRYSILGNLIRNGRFEEGLSYWESCNVKIVTGKETHEGLGAAGLGAYGKNRKPAWLLQCVPLKRWVFPLYLQLIFSVAGGKPAPADLDVSLGWYDRYGMLIEDGITAHIQKRAIGNGSRGQWNAYTFVSGRSPTDACYAVLRFYKRPALKRLGFVIIDDVALIPIL